MARLTAPRRILLNCAPAGMVVSGNDACSASTVIGKARRLRQQSGWVPTFVSFRALDIHFLIG